MIIYRSKLSSVSPLENRKTMKIRKEKEKKKERERMIRGINDGESKQIINIFLD